MILGVLGIYSRSAFSLGSWFTHQSNSEKYTCYGDPPYPRTSLSSENCKVFNLWGGRVAGPDPLT